MILEEVKNLKYANEEQTMINVVLKFEGIEEEFPFTASQNDPEPHGRELYARLVEGEFGEIAAYQGG